MNKYSFECDCGRKSTLVMPDASVQVTDWIEYNRANRYTLQGKNLAEAREIAEEEAKHNCTGE